MKRGTVSMSEVVNKSLSDFTIEYELIGNLSYKHFPGCLLNFSYDNNPSMEKIFCDIFPEFIKNCVTMKLVGPNEFIPSKGLADMWIVSDMNRNFHESAIYNGRTCYLLKGGQVVAKCTIVRSSNHLKLVKLRNKNAS